MENTIPNETPSQKKRMFPYIVSKSRYLALIAAFTTVGVLGGLGYFVFVGCETNACGITSSPYLSMVWGGLLGYVLPDIFVKTKKEEAGK